MKWHVRQIAIISVLSLFALPGRTLCADGGTAVAKGRLAGRVLAPEGTPVVGAQVIYDRVREYRQNESDHRIYELNPELYASGIVVTLKDGGFLTPDVPAGDYQICVEVPRGGFLDLCKWSPPTRAVAPAGSPVEIRLTRGAEVRVRIEDPAGLTPTYNNLREVPSVVVGVQTETGAYHALRIDGKDKDGWDLRLTVPFDTALKLWVYSPGVELADAVGQRVDAARGLHIPFQVTRAANARQFTLVATGRLVK